MPRTRTETISRSHDAVATLRAIGPARNRLECHGCGAGYYSASPRAVLLERPACTRCGAGLDRA
jgi:hypothetical protein